jgi:hypothetical protein
MGTREMTDDLVREIADDLRARYGLDDDDVRALAARLAGDQDAARHEENRRFAERFTSEHRETFDRLAK